MCKIKSPDAISDISQIFRYFLFKWREMLLTFQSGLPRSFINSFPAWEDKLSSFFFFISYYSIFWVHPLELLPFNLTSCCRAIKERFYAQCILGSYIAFKSYTEGDTKLLWQQKTCLWTKTFVILAFFPLFILLLMLLCAFSILFWKLHVLLIDS